VLEECAGTDASEPFEYAGHTSDAVKSMQQFLVGITEDVDSVKDTILDSAPPVSIPTLRKVHGNAGGAQNFKYIYILAVAAGMCILYWNSTYRKGAVERPAGVDAGTAVGMDGFTLSLYATALMLVFGGWGLMFLYSEFIKTLHQKEVFEYPPVIPRGSRKI
jgi:hypothetical protein